MRDLVKVIEKIQAEIPGGITTQLWSALEHQRSSQMYRAPEDTSGWYLVSGILEDYLGCPDEGWKKRIRSIFANRKSK
jgi:hypothetical protein